MAYALLNPKYYLHFFGVALLAFFMLSGCAGQAPKPMNYAEAENYWQKFIETKPSSPYRLELSLRLGLKGDTRRVTALLWGNDSTTIRLDAMAGVGSIVAQIFSDSQNFLVVAPTESLAYTHTGSNQPLLKIGGLPLPLSLHNLTDILTGHAAKVFGQSHGEVKTQNKGLLSYKLLEKMPGEITLDAKGRLVGWNSSSWTMQVEYDEQDCLSRLSLENHKGERTILTVRDRAKVAPFTLAQMSLTIPNGFKIKPLANYTSQTF